MLVDLIVMIYLVGRDENSLIVLTAAAAQRIKINHTKFLYRYTYIYIYISQTPPAHTVHKHVKGFRLN